MEKVMGGERAERRTVLVVAFDAWTGVRRLSKYLPAEGWDPVVLTAVRPSEPTGFEFGQVSASLPVISTGWTDWTAPLLRVARGVRRVLPTRRPRGAAGATAAATPPTAAVRGSSWTLSGTRLPDVYMGWLPHAVPAGVRIIRERGVRAIYASAMPVTSLLVGAELHRRTGVPWIAEYRDAWTTSFWATRPRGIQQAEALIERAVVRSASVVTAVTRPLANDLQTLHRRPVRVITNGFDPDDYRTPVARTPTLTITYTGTLAPRRPVRPFMDALATLLRDGTLDSSVRVRYWGRGAGQFIEAARDAGVAHVVEDRGEVSPEEAARRQQESTLLLLLETLTPDAKIMATAKLYDYLGAGRPILAFGPKGGAIDSILKETGAGELVSSAEEATSVLGRWLAAYRAGDAQMGLSPNADAIGRYSRRAQAAQMARLLDGVARPA